MDLIKGKLGFFAAVLTAVIWINLNAANIAILSTVGCSLVTTSTTMFNYFSDYMFSGLSREERLKNFLEQNRTEVASDISRGSGEYLNSVAEIVDVFPMRRIQFGLLLQKNFDSVFPENTADAEQSALSIIDLAREASLCSADD